jgi:uncharacterized caspase-like protein
MHCLVRFALAGCCILAGLNLAPAEARRVALVIGNAEHRFLEVLKNPVNDATAVAEALKKLDFDKVILKRDIGVQGFRTALGELSREAKGAEAALMFFAGNGIQVDGRNYLIPTDARLAQASDVESEAVALQTVIEHVSGASLGIVILDACRNNPFAGRWTGGTRGVHRGVERNKGPATGLAKVEQQPSSNLFLVYASQPGTAAADGIGPHSPFTAALLKHLPVPGLELRHLFVRVRAEVVAVTGGHQSPEVWDSAAREFFFARVQ